ncbi:GNAT family N-acetyltransferase [Actibacterium pelagium]|uniref:N-acetyltransferase n=1 Tax=Actibacterium pelagium TaxID=2029103 RepID=A0A917AB99_9RHOB|nr:GNAT family N-acetyltransferase [Actibacterium pelagium]GGE40789.1 N-acetyltransferase [Actibacterium pelagium]
MTLAPGFHDVPSGHLAAVVTHLQMLDRPPARPSPDLQDLSLIKHETVAPDWYRDMFRRIGQDYLWFSRLHMKDADLAQIFETPDYDLYTLRKGDDDLALLELDFRKAGECELAFFGLDAALIGTGAGRLLMNHAIDLAFTRPITRFHVHTCTLDSPQALGFYVRSGFTPYRTEVEIAPDPRLTGDLPESAAPQIPLIR